MRARKRYSERGTSFCLYETARGWGAVVAGSGGLMEVYLPFEEHARKDLLARLAEDYPEAVEGHDYPAGQAAGRLARYFAGQPESFADLPVDLSCFSSFQREVYRLVASVPHGHVLTYAAVAAAVGRPRAARGIGQAMGRNPLPVIIPCHRIVGSSGAMTGYSAPGGIESKQWLLRLEGVVLTVQGRMRLDGEAKPHYSIGGYR